MEMSITSIDPKTDINAQDWMGRTPLHRSVMEGDLSLTKELLENGAVVSLQDLRGDSPLHKAVEINNLQIVELLLKHDAQVNLRND